MSPNTTHASSFSLQISVSTCSSVSWNYTTSRSGDWAPRTPLHRARTRNERSSYGRHGTCMSMSPVFPYHKRRWSPWRRPQNRERNLQILTHILLDLWQYQDEGDSSAFDSKSYRVVCTWRRFNADSTCKFGAIERNVHIHIFFISVVDFTFGVMNWNLWIDRNLTVCFIVKIKLPNVNVR